MKEIFSKLFKWLVDLLFMTYNTIENYGDKINVNCMFSNRKWNYIDIAKQVLYQQLHIDNVLLNIVENTKALDKLSPDDIEYQAILVKTAPKAYTLYARKSSFSPTMLCHELKHLEQYEKNKLQLLDSKAYKWLGKEYPASYPYDSRPWEREAFAAQATLWRNYKFFKKNKKNETTKTRI